MRLKVDGMDCPSCIRKIETALGRVDGVSDVSVNFAAETVSMRVAANGPQAETLLGHVRSLGFGASPFIAGAARATAGARGHAGHAHGHAHHPDHTHDHDQAHAAPEHRWWQTPRGRHVLTAAALLVAAFLAARLVPGVGEWGYVAATIVGVVPVARRAIVLARTGSPFSIEMLLTIAATGAVAIGAFEESAIVVFLFTLGELLEGMAAGRARSSIRALAGLVPRTALVEIDGAAREVPAASLRVDDVVLVRPGDKIPADGEVIDGESAVDESPITGESVPLAKQVGDTVFAGSINTAAALRVRIARAAEDNTIARIVRLVEEADAAKAPTVRFIDRFSTVYTPIVVAFAVLVAVVPPLMFGQPWHDWVYRALALLLIACPCALVISTPAAITSGLSAGARRGLLMKGGVVLEAMSAVRAIAFDKTGTLTEGRPRVTDVVGFGRAEASVLSLAASVEVGSSHPIAKAIVDHAAVAELDLSEAIGQRSIAGKAAVATIYRRTIVVGSPRYLAETGTVAPDIAAAIARLEADGKTVVGVRDDVEIVGVIALRDEPRADAREGLATLRALGVQTVMLTGDNARTARAIGERLAIEARAELLPEDKVAAVRELATRAPVAKIGDGINDAPALAAAHVGIAMGSGTDVALATAGAAMLNNRVGDVAVMVRLARATMANIRQNVAIALGLKALFLVTTVFGVTNLWIAVLADTGATVLVTLNAMRLLRFR
ncbi:MAG: cadmium-translocating P-type ATPase [Alphaproteobacteria bacterium]|nr:cadmium-translocating P-type ATPase [Alphaproteobacteria bacterium]